MLEVWKDIKGYEGLYQVSNLGRVKRLPRLRKNRWGKSSFYPEELMALCLDGKKYQFVKLQKNGKRKQFKVHRLVAEYFLNKRQGYNQVNHIDKNKQNNVVTNLEWCNQYENMSHRYADYKVRTSSFIGVHLPRCRKHLPNPYIACISVDDVYKHLGCFETEEEAHQAYLDALKEYGLINKYAS